MVSFDSLLSLADGYRETVAQHFTDGMQHLSLLLRAGDAYVEAASQKISEITGLPAGTALAVLIGTLTLLFLLLRPRRNLAPPPSSSSTKPSREIGEMTLEELAAYDGSDPDKPILVAIRGRVYDVSRSAHLYGPEGGYSGFSGKDASRALAKMSMDATDAVGDLTGLTLSELDTLNEWEAQYQFKYDVVGYLAGSPADPQAAQAKSSTS